MSPAPATESDRRTQPVAYVVAGLIIAAVAFIALTSTLGSNANSTFSFVGSAIKPAAGADAGGQERAAREAAPAVAQAPAPPAGANAPPAPGDRKIIYSARLDVVVKSLDEATKAVDEKLASHSGRLVRSEARSDSGAHRSATFTLEVPVDKFRGLVAALKELGVPERDAVDSQDVTEEFVDLEARLRNMRNEEETLNRILKEKSGNVTEMLAVRAQLAPVREQIERAEGRVKYLAARAAFSTVTLTLREVADYRPPTAPTFGDRVGRTFGNSWNALRAFGEGAALFAVAVSVWLPLLVPLGVAGVWVVRGQVRKSSASVRPRRPASGPAVEVIDPNRTTPME